MTRRPSLVNPNLLHRHFPQSLSEVVELGLPEEDEKTVPDDSEQSEISDGELAT